MEKKDYIYLFLLCIIFNLLCGVGYFTGYFINANIFNFSMVIFYPLMGYGIDKCCKNIKTRFLVFLTVLSEGFAVVLGIIYIKIFPYNSGEVVNVFQLFIPLVAIEIFMILKVGCKETKSKLIGNIGQAVFGIYLIEDVVRNQVEKVISKIDLNFIGSEFVLCMIYVFASFTISLLIVISFREIYLRIKAKFQMICDKIH